MAEAPEQKDLRQNIIALCELYLAASEALEGTVALAERLSAGRVISIDRREPSRLDLHIAYFHRAPGAFLTEQARDIRSCIACGMRSVPLSGQWSRVGKVAAQGISMWYHWAALLPAAALRNAGHSEARHINQLLNLMEPMAA